MSQYPVFECLLNTYTSSALEHWLSSFRKISSWLRSSVARELSASRLTRVYSICRVSISGNTIRASDVKPRHPKVAPNRFYLSASSIEIAIAFSVSDMHREGIMYLPPRLLDEQ